MSATHRIQVCLQSLIYTVHWTVYTSTMYFWVPNCSSGTAPGDGDVVWCNASTTKWQVWLLLVLASAVKQLQVQTVNRFVWKKTWQSVNVQITHCTSYIHRTRRTMSARFNHTATITTTSTNVIYCLNGLCFQRLFQLGRVLPKGL